MIPIISIVGKSNSGKTTFIEKLIPEFKRRGYRVGTVKHHLHDFELDKEGKDSWRHAQAGAETVVIASPYKVGLVKTLQNDLSLELMREKFFDGVDLILAEGYKTGNYPKIEIFRAAVHDKPLFSNDHHLLALVTDDVVPTAGAPCFRFEDYISLVDFLEETFLVEFPAVSRTIDPEILNH